jgi:hypothetical protein
MNRMMIALVALCALAPLGCRVDDLLDVRDPDIVTPENISDASALPTLRNSVIGDFSLAYSGSGADGSGGTEGQIMASGLLADEWINSETFPTRIEVDRRGPIRVDNGTTQNWFRTLSRARRAAEFAASKYEELAPNLAREAGYPEILALAGFTYTFFGENYCSGVPISNVLPNGELEFGQPLTTAQLYEGALARFDAALAAANALDDATAGTPVSPATKVARIRLTQVGRARVLLDQGNFATAAAAVSGIPTSFVYLMGHSENSARQNNGVFVANRIAERYSVSDREGTNGLPFRGDVRVQAIRTGGTNVGFDNATPQWDQLKYFSRKHSIPLASGLEARLIEAEALLRAGDSAGALAIHNALRAAPPAYITIGDPPLTLAPLAALTDAGVQASGGYVTVHFAERASWLYATAHRLSDLRRLVRQYGRATESVFPTGAYFKGGFTYGTDVNFPVPVDEENNPNFVQCLDRNP